MKRFNLFLLVFSLVSVIGSANPLRFNYEEGFQYVENKVVIEQIYMNEEFSHSSHINERISSTVIDEDDGIGTILNDMDISVYKAVFGSKKGYVVEDSKRYTSKKDKYGNIKSSSDKYFPVLRNIPVFYMADKEPEIDMNWYGKGFEVHSLKEYFDIDEKLIIPVAANYKYLGKKFWHNKKYPAIKVKYTIYYRVNDMYSGYKTYPVKVLGNSERIIYWNEDLGIIAGSDEVFKITFEMSDGQSIRYEGESHTKVLKTKKLTEAELNDIKSLQDKTTSVEAMDKGIGITLQKIRFTPDSTKVLKEEEERLDKIGRKLLKYKDRDILIIGHTAMAGTAIGRKELSVKRAAVIRDYYVGKGILNIENVRIQGKAGDEPIAPNDTPENMSKNRRVEIIILNN